MDMTQAQSLMNQLPRHGGDAVLGGILITGVLGQGGMGIVLRGLHLRLSIPVAIKFLNVSPNVDMRVIVNEAQLAARINHVNVVRVYDVNREGGLVYAVQELVEGQTVEDYIRAAPGGLPEAFVLSVAADVARGLEAIHAKGVIHRDIKPSNLIVTKAENLTKILDLGVAYQVGQDPQTGEAKGPPGETQFACGTPGYISPETLWNLPASFPADIYSLGVTLFEMATGMNPFPAESVTRMIAMATEQEVPDVRTIRADYSGFAAGLIAKCTRINPADRFQTATELLAELAQAGAQAPARAKQAAGAGPLVLCAEDQEEMALFIREVLEEGGYRVVACVNGKEALQKIPEAKPVVVLLDIDMPVMNGLEACRALREDPAYKDLPVIFLTGHDDAESVRKAVWGGATDYLTKPFDPADLLERVHCQTRLSTMQREFDALHKQSDRFRQQLKTLMRY
ncbi:MAG: protein kinase [Planctomycetota bacterium]|nr:protein kinase [Planctomycetota bacterium]